MAGESPDWIRDAYHQFVGELRLFLRTAVDVTRQPIRFAEEWVQGRRHALNPLGFLATAFAVVGPALALLRSYTKFGGDQPSSLWLEMLGALLPFVHFLLLGALQHLFYRLGGSRRPLRDSLAMALYAAGGAGGMAQLLVMALLVVTYRCFGVLDMGQVPAPWKLPFLLLVLGQYALLYAVLGAAIAGVHRRPGWRGWQVPAANLFAIAVTSCLFAMAHPPGSFGLHLYCGPRFHDGAWRFSMGATL
jgi:hypothetical protein